jgi:aminoglycoside phosphotransferase (APT) family kinase protein
MTPLAEPMAVDKDELAGIGEALLRVFPDLGAVMPLRVLGEGFRSLAAETSGGRVFRIAKHAAATEGYLTELRLLPHLRARLPIPVPDPRWYAAPSELFPFGVMGYAKLAGRPLLPEALPGADVDRLASDLASFLLALHRFPVEEAAALGVPGPGDGRAALESLREDVLPALREALTARGYGAVLRWWDAFLLDERMSRYEPVLRHGDLWYEHVLVDDALRSVVGILDFESASVGDPAQDIATQLYLGEGFAARVIDAYRGGGGVVDGDFLYRVRRLWELREFGGVQFAVRFDDPEELEDSVAKLRAGPVLRA